MIDFIIGLWLLIGYFSWILVVSYFKKKYPYLKNQYCASDLFMLPVMILFGGISLFSVFVFLADEAFERAGK